MARPRSDLDRVGAALDEYGILLLSDAKLPSVASIVAGESIRGSWWGHPKGHAIFNTAEALEERADVTVAKLVSGKVTYVHCRLWPALVAVRVSRGAWQLDGLRAPARQILKEVERSGAARTDALTVALKMTSKEVAKAALDLEKRLLLHATEVHTHSGAHAKELESWNAWASRAKVSKRAITLEGAKLILEETLARLNEEFEGRGSLYWQGNARSRP